MQRYNADLHIIIDEQMQSNRCNDKKPVNDANSIHWIGQIAIGIKALPKHGISSHI